MGLPAGRVRQWPLGFLTRMQCWHLPIAPQRGSERQGRWVVCLATRSCGLTLPSPDCGIPEPLRGVQPGLGCAGHSPSRLILKLGPVVLTSRQDPARPCELLRSHRAGTPRLELFLLHVLSRLGGTMAHPTVLGLDKVESGLWQRALLQHRLEGFKK